MIKEIHGTTKEIIIILDKGKIFPYLILYIPVFLALLFSILINKVKGGN